MKQQRRWMTQHVSQCWVFLMIYKVFEQLTQIGPEWINPPACFYCLLRSFKKIKNKNFPKIALIQITYPYKCTMYNSDSKQYNWKRWQSPTWFLNFHMFSRLLNSVCVRMWAFWSYVNYAISYTYMLIVFGLILTILTSFLRKIWVRLFSCFKEIIFRLKWKYLVTTYTLKQYIW